jgi:hypothetical protein
MKKPFPKAKRQLEYVAFFHFQVSTKEGHVLFSLLSMLLVNLLSVWVSNEMKVQSLFLRIFTFSVEQSDFAKYIDLGFTLVLGEHEELAEEMKTRNPFHKLEGVSLPKPKPVTKLSL